jgi:cytoskeletal protein CcmA (bactofilin family)
MLNFNRRDHTDPRESKELTKPGLKPAIYEPPHAQTNVATAATAPRVTPPSPAPTARDSSAVPQAPQRDTPPTPPAAPAQAAAQTKPRAAESAESKLLVGVKIQLRGVEISNCDILAIEGEVEATVHSGLLQIAEPGRLTGTAEIEVAEVHGEFSGELTARTRLVVHSTGRVSGVIRYGKLVVEEGGLLSGDVKRLDQLKEDSEASRTAAADRRRSPGPMHDAAPISH